LQPETAPSKSWDAEIDGLENKAEAAFEAIRDPALPG